MGQEEGKLEPRSKCFLGRSERGESTGTGAGEEGYGQGGGQGEPCTALRQEEKVMVKEVADWEQWEFPGIAEGHSEIGDLGRLVWQWCME